MAEFGISTAIIAAVFVIHALLLVVLAIGQLMQLSSCQQPKPMKISLGATASIAIAVTVASLGFVGSRWNHSGNRWGVIVIAIILLVLVLIAYIVFADSFFTVWACDDDLRSQATIAYVMGFIGAAIYLAAAGFLGASMNKASLSNREVAKLLRRKKATHKKLAESLTASLTRALED